MPRTALIALLGLLGLASTAPALDEEPVDLAQAAEEIPDDELLDVGIHVFGTGIPEDENQRYLLEEKGVFEDVRKSEARWIPMVLKRTLESTGYWGAVRVIPTSNQVDLIVDGTIVNSNGKRLEIDIMVFDATGKRWLSKRYKDEANVLAYEDGSGLEPFQDIYNQIANDLLKERREIEDEDFTAIRRVTELKFASDLAPSKFQSYLAVKKGRYAPSKLPADGDPMMGHVEAIRSRDHMFIDTLNEHYADLYSKMEGPYGGWRSASYEEQDALDKLTKTSRLEMILGAAAAIGGVIASSRGGRGWGNAGEAMILGGIMVGMDGLDKNEQRKMNRAALNELAGSFDSEVSELLVDNEGEVLRLKGSVEAQYASWRQLLRNLFATEMGLPLDPNVAPLPEPVGTPKS